MSTDRDWEKWGAIDPYFGVYSDDRYRADAITDEARAAFFQSGEAHVEKTLRTIRDVFDAAFVAPQTALDFGSGVGRIVLPLAIRAERVVGVDVSPSMIAEATRNCQLAGIGNVRFVDSVDVLARNDEYFNLAHSEIVFPHIPWRRGRRILQSLAGRVAVGGYLAVQLLTACSTSLPIRALVQLRYSFPPANWARNLLRSRALLEPAMQLHVYRIDDVLHDLETHGFGKQHCVREVWGDFTSTTIYAKRSRH
jgi:SAM-dependent methyltransferase